MNLISRSFFKDLEDYFVDCEFKHLEREGNTLAHIVANAARKEKSDSEIKKLLAAQMGETDVEASETIEETGEAAGASEDAEASETGEAAEASETREPREAESSED
ncbi:hypothetical protein V6N13_139276 [Hibiscus sabdariffa]|uniref:RNase H type-1 domain-containing protein n=1 Tax=Hibiscus sabdariffa TaxID=183260 RepID=A0ABR2C8K3_9ROSI